MREIDAIWLIVALTAIISNIILSILCHVLYFPQYWAFAGMAICAGIAWLICEVIEHFVQP